MYRCLVLFNMDTRMLKGLDAKIKCTRISNFQLQGGVFQTCSTPISKECLYVAERDDINCIIRNVCNTGAGGSLSYKKKTLEGFPSA